MYLGNVMLLVLNLPLIGLWVHVLRIPYPFLFPLIVLFCLIGAYSLSNNIFDVFIMVLFGIIGYLMKKVRFEAAPMLLGMVLGLMMEDALRQSLIMSGGSFQIFVTRPISAGFIIAALVLLAIPAIRGGKKLLVAKLTENE
jgi:TctA family transporter